MGFGVWGLGFGVWGLGFGVWGLGLQGLGLGALGGSKPQTLPVCRGLESLFRLSLGASGCNGVYKVWAASPAFPRLQAKPQDCMSCAWEL